MQSFSAAIATLALTGFASAQVIPFSQDFEGMAVADGLALENDGWLVYGNVFDDQNNYLYGYGSFPAPNPGVGFCSLTSGQGSAAQGANQLEVYSDYGNADMNNFDYDIEGNTYREWFLDPSDVSKTFEFSFDAKLGDLVVPSESIAFIKVINTNTWNLAAFVGATTASISGATWSQHAVQYTIEPGQENFLFQIGFLSLASNHDGSSIYYDNLELVDIGGNPPVGSNYCSANANSTGSAASIAGFGSASVLSNSLQLVAGPVPQQPGLFYYGPNQIQLTFGNGFRCIGGAIVRLPVMSPTAGELIFNLDNTNVPPAGAIIPGSVWNFQAWYRDPQGGGAAYNLSNGLEVTFTP
ncbi:MAG: hypothetical protein ACI841_001051 [Planctomycetota bacterium]|jgi:hypothetical protein